MPDEWRIILDFLRRTDPALVARIGRRMLNHLSWSGVPDARALLQRTAAPMAGPGSEGENRPIDDRHLPPPIDAVREAFLAVLALFAMPAHDRADTDLKRIAFHGLNLKRRLLE